MGTLASAFWLSLFLLGRFTFHGSSADKRALFWTAAMVASFAGWGSAVSLLLDGEGEVDWGLRAAWGMGAFACIGGALVAVGIGSGPVLRLMVAIGLGILCANALRPNPRPWRPRTDGAYWTILFIVVPLAFLTCVGSMTDRGTWWAYDDTPAYLVFPKQLFQMGDMLQPFSFRRMSSFGAQSLFQATLLVGASPEQVALFDRGICGVVVVAMIMGAPIGHGSAPYAVRLLPALVVLLLPNYRMNCAAVLSGTVFFFAIYRTFEIPESSTRKPRMKAAVLGLLVAGACALRPFFALPATLTLVLAFLLRAKDRSVDRRDILKDALVAGGVTLLALLPWSVALIRSNGTPLYPPFDGDYRSQSGFTHLVLGYERFKMIWEELRYWEPLGTVHLFLIAGLIPLKRDTPGFRASYCALLFGFLAMLLLIPITDYRDLVRYVYPLEVAFALAVAMRSLSAPTHTGGPATMAAVLVVAACVGELYWKHDEAQRAYDDMFEQAYNLFKARTLVPGGGHTHHADGDEMSNAPLISLQTDQTYSELQRSVPEGAPIVAMVEEPYRFDFRRNRVDILDLPGIVGPRRGIPIFRGPEAMATYFRSLGIRYLVLVDTHTCLELYSLHVWEQHSTSTGLGPQTFIAPWVLDIFANMERLGQSRRHLAEEAGMVVLDLEESQ